MSGMERGRVLLRAAALIKDNLEEFSRAETLDNGKPVWASRMDLDTVIFVANIVLDSIWDQIRMGYRLAFVQKPDNFSSSLFQLFKFFRITMVKLLYDRDIGAGDRLLGILRRHGWVFGWPTCSDGRGFVGLRHPGPAGGGRRNRRLELPNAGGTS